MYKVNSIDYFAREDLERKFNDLKTALDYANIESNYAENAVGIWKSDAALPDMIVYYGQVYHLADGNKDGE